MSKLDLLDSLKTQFDPTKFIITKKENTFYVKSIENKYCCTIFINDANEIEIGLHKCSISGGEILEKIEKFAKSVGINKLTLGDISELDLGCIKLDLAIFYILHSNYSWYNSKGYVSPIFKFEQKSNKKLLKIPIDDFLEQCFYQIIDKEHQELIGKIREVLANYKKNELLIRIGEYKPCSDKNADFAIKYIEKVNRFLKQQVDEECSFEETLVQLKALFR